VRRIDLAPKWSRLRVAIVLGLCGFALLGWQGASTVGHNGAIDAGEHLRYAEFLATHHRLPPKTGKDANYEYASPPLFQATAVLAEKLVRIVPAAAAELPWNVATRAVWLALAAAGAVALAASRRRVRIAGAAALGLAGLWGLDEAVVLCKSEEWTAGQLIAVACGAGLIVVSGLIAREIWPGNTRRAVSTGAFVAAYPVVYRMSILFHPEVPFALLCAIAMLLFLRAARLDWPARWGFGVGIAAAAAVLTRQPGALLVVCLAAATLGLGGRRALPFLVRAAIPVVLVAGPWWIYATYRFHNPVQSNLDLAPARMLSSEPGSFYASAPLRTLVADPYRPRITNELLPKLHADLWSDWYGAIHSGWVTSSKVDRVTASTQSVLGFVADLLAVGGLVALAIPSGVRAFRRRSRAPADVGLGFLALVALVAFAAFVVNVARFPQRDGDPIKSSYLLFTAPCWAAFSVAAWSEIRARRRQIHALLVVAAALYACSYASDLGAALDHNAAIGNLGQLPNVVDLSTTFQQNSPNPGIGGPIDFLVGVNENGSRDATGVRLRIVLSSAITLSATPFAAQGTCRPGVPIVCDLGELPGGKDTYIRFEVNVEAGGPQTLTATASADQTDSSPGNDTSTDTVNLGPT
jgi:4-amino-4-deoxy-L-arabinose transferase-like glycosyltransferase